MFFTKKISCDGIRAHAEDFADTICANTDVCFGSKADICNANRRVRFALESNIKCDIWRCPIRAKSGHSRRVRPFIEKRYRAMLNMRGRGHFTGSDLVYWLVRRSRTTIQIMVAIISMPPRADASAQ